MIDPFDAEFLSQELRDSWKKIEELEKENKELREKLNKEQELYCNDEFNENDWGRE